MSKKRAILIVDNVELNSALLQDMLEDENQILETSNGLEASNHLRSNAAAILLHRVKNTILLFAKQKMMQNVEKSWCRRKF